MTDQQQPQPYQPGQPRRTQPLADFGAQYGAHCKPVFREIVARDLAEGGAAAERARTYADRGKPDFVLAYLLASDLADAEKRELYAQAFARRAELTEQKADELDQQFHRPFPLLRLEASKDHTTSQRIRSGGGLRPGLGRPLPTL